MYKHKGGFGGCCHLEDFPGLEDLLIPPSSFFFLKNVIAINEPCQTLFLASSLLADTHYEFFLSTILYQFNYYIEN